VLEQVIDLTDKWWSNVGEKQAMSIILGTAAPGPGAPMVVRYYYFSYEANSGVLIYIYNHYV
jgi:hypothetical protein